MKVAIVFESKTGNTEKIANAIKSEIKSNDVIYFGEPKENIEADLYFVGSWTDKGECTKKVTEFLRKLEYKKIAYFGTAGFGGSKEYYNTLFERVKNVINSNNKLYDYFYCQGKMPISVRNKYVQMITANPEDRKLKVSIENFDKALSHPNEEDIKVAKLWAKDIYSDAENE